MAEAAVVQPSAEEARTITAMAFVADAVAQGRISSDLFGVTLGKANMREGSIDTALALSEWPRDLDLLIVDLATAHDPVADAAALKTALPGSCMVIGIGRINDVALYRDLMAVGFNDYLSLPLAEGAMGRAVDRAREQRVARAERAAAETGETFRQSLHRLRRSVGNRFIETNRRCRLQIGPADVNSNPLRLLLRRHSYFRTTIATLVLFGNGYMSRRVPLDFRQLFFLG